MKEQIHKELASLQSELSRLDSAVKHIEDAKQLAKDITKNGHELQDKYKEQLQEVKDLTAKYQELVGRAEKLIDKIDKVDFPTRLDKLDAAVTAINQGLQNTQTKLENLGRDLKDEIKEAHKVLSYKLDMNQKESNNKLTALKDDMTAFKAEVNSQFSINQKELKLLKIFGIAIIILCIGIIVIGILK
ncbi:MAG: hypothetical protein KatS3mg028_1416 [Bacteroidia bacterium]|nr:MAG: hypothetical protein KatS3mg028_1416 [Bacteroidia bacterium]GIV34116.1 MAG: hypothetical protein KatS3mg031_1651 [Chitinophagales bacterium]